MDSIDQRFKVIVEALREYLAELKQEFLKLEKNEFDEKARISFLCSRRKEIFSALDRYFAELWEQLLAIPQEDQDVNRSFFEERLIPYLADDIETNSYIRARPLGYAGDYVTMNFIYDYHDGMFMGNTLYAKLINHYTCNIDVARSNLARKSYIKSKIQEEIAKGPGKVILSVGCGPAREIMELIQEGKITGKVSIHLLDLEKNAIQYVQQELERLDYDRSLVDVQLHLLDLIEIVKNKRIKQLFGHVDLVYVSGVFDYLKGRTAKSVLQGLVEVSGHRFILFNMSEENARHRAYYEVFGGWKMFHRKKEEVLAWTSGLSEEYGIIIENHKSCSSYWILKIDKV